MCHVKTFSVGEGCEGVVSGLVNVLSTHLDFLKGNVLEGGREAHFRVDPRISPMRGSRINFLPLLISDLQARFRSGEWADTDVPDWVEASSCSCVRVFSYMLACDFGQSTEHMCEMLWVCCNGEDIEH